MNKHIQSTTQSLWYGYKCLPKKVKLIVYRNERKEENNDIKKGRKIVRERNREGGTYRQDAEKRTETPFQ